MTYDSFSEHFMLSECIKCAFHSNYMLFFLFSVVEDLLCGCLSGRVVKFYMSQSFGTLPWNIARVMFYNVMLQF